MKKVLWVVAAALVTPDYQVLLSQRPAGKTLAGLWEYPGGKIEKDETPEIALCRELNEELSLSVLPEDLEPLTFASFDYPDFHLVMPLFVCRKWQGDIVPKEGQKVAFVDAKTVGSDLDGYPMPPADDKLSLSLRQWAEIERKGR